MPVKYAEVSNSNVLAGTLSQQQQQILNRTLRQHQVQQNIKSVLGDHKRIYGAIMGSIKFIYNYLERNDEIIKKDNTNKPLSIFA
jgi:hypothetical protein